MLCSPFLLPLPPFHFSSTSPIHYKLRRNRHLTFHFPKSLLSSPTDHPLQAAGPEVPHDDLPRKQNSRSTSLLLRRLDGFDPGSAADRDSSEDAEKKMRMLEELEMIGKRRNPRFPGAVDFPREGVTVAELFGDDDRALRQALEIRRQVAAEVLKVAMRSSRISINYSNNLVGKLPEFVDLVIVEAAAMKGVAEFSHLSFNARARSYIRSSGVVALVKWLKHNSMSYPQIGKVICMCPGKLELIRSAVEWLKRIHVKGENIGHVLVKAGYFWERGVEELNGTIDYLEENGVRRDWIGFVVTRCPKLLSFSMEELERRVRFYMDMGINRTDFGTMIFDYPKALGFFSLEEMDHKVSYLKEFGLDTHDVGRLLAYKPQLMGCSIEERWKPLVKYLYYLGLHRDGMKRMLMVKPMIFCVDLETSIAPKVRFLQDIGIREDTIGSVLVKFPSILTYSLYKKIRPVVIFLMTKAGVSEKNIGKVIASEPELVGCSIVHKLDVSVKYFLSLGIRPQSLGEMIADFPMILKYNLDILRPKYRYLRRVMVRPLEDLIEFPRYFSYSLEKRIIPRHKVLVDNHINFKLRYMLAGSDKIFDDRVRLAIEKRQKFESGKVENFQTTCNLMDVTSDTNSEGSELSWS